MNDLAARAASTAATAARHTPLPFKQSLAVEGAKLLDENLGNSLAAVFELLELEDGGSGLDNPMFTDHGHGGPSPNTDLYFGAKKVAEMTSVVATNLADVGGVVSGVQTVVYGHAWYRLNALFSQLIPESRRAKKTEYSAWYSWTVEKKAVPAGSLETLMAQAMRQKMYGAAASGTKAGIKLGTGGITGFFVDSTASWVAPTLDRYLGQDTQTLAKGLHWLGFREKAVGGGHARSPARRILDAVWQDFSYGQLSGVTLDDILGEPRGWLVIADMLN